MHRHVSMVVYVIISESAQFSNIKQSCCKKEECRERERESQTVRERARRREEGRETACTCMFAGMHGHVFMFVYMRNGSLAYVLKLCLSCFAKMHRMLRHTR